jgi:hypothetical protein
VIELGRELDLAGKRLIKTKTGTILRQLYVDVIDGTFYISRKFSFIQVVKQGNIFVIPERG